MFLFNIVKSYFVAVAAIYADMERREKEAEYAGILESHRVLPITTMIKYLVLVPPLARYCERKLL